jgi:hypothetical protein
MRRRNDRSDGRTKPLDKRNCVPAHDGSGYGPCNGIPVSPRTLWPEGKSLTGALPEAQHISEQTPYQSFIWRISMR